LFVFSERGAWDGQNCDCRQRSTKDASGGAAQEFLAAISVHFFLLLPYIYMVQMHAPRKLPPDNSPLCPVHGILTPAWNQN
jgi:hypothetical protein